MFQRPADTIKAARKVARFEAACPFPDAELDRLKQRRAVLHRLPKDSIGAEIGVFRGHFSQAIVEIAQPKKLYLVDPWTLVGETFGWGKAYTNFGKLRTADAREEARARVEALGQTDLHMIEGFFPQCADRFQELLDWIYLDTSHIYDRTLAELRVIPNFLKPDGWILGDDWAPDPKNPHFGVFQAVQEFSRTSDWCLTFAGPGNQWAMRRYPALGH